MAKNPNPTVDSFKRLVCSDLYALQAELVSKVRELTMKSVPAIEPTCTGWAIRPADLDTRDLLVSQQAQEAISEIFHATAVRIPQRWYTYVVRNIPSSFQGLMGSPIPVDAQLISDEVAVQAGAQPVDCHMSRHGADPHTGRATWVMSFLTPVRFFRLFGSPAVLVNKKPAITIHDPGCQGYCNPVKCTKYARCHHCDVPVREHKGPTGANCTARAKCANCLGPFEAGHDHCPAAPRREHGRVVRPSKQQLRQIRNFGEKAYQAEASPAATTTSPLATSAYASFPPAVQAKRPGAVISDYEAAGQSPSPDPFASSLPASPCPAPETGRPRCSAAPTHSLNDRVLSQAATNGFQVLTDHMAIDSSETDLP